MGSLVLVAVVAAVAFLWARGAHRNRLRWLERLDLPGTWCLENTAASATLELNGSLSGGDYVETTDEHTETGSWRLVGHTLSFVSVSGTSDCDLRLFDAGRIGIDGPGRERRIYERRQNNVVPLRRELH
jgi:hypothetical protein